MSADVSALRDGRLRIVVSGFLGLLPAGGVTWDYVQYPLGLLELGHDVFYVEDTRLWPVWQVDRPGDARGNVRQLARMMDEFGLGDRWSYRDEVTSQWFGISDRRRREVLRTADVIINVSGSMPPREEHACIPIRVMIDSDPMFTQVQNLSGLGLDGRPSGMRELLEHHTHHFTFGENIGAGDCRVPGDRFCWRPTRQPVVLSGWPYDAEPAGSFTTVMNWRAAAAMHYEGERWGQKDVEFERFSSVPSAVPGVRFSVALGRTVGQGPPTDRLMTEGWEIVDAATVAGDHRSYQTFLRRSLGEFSVAKEAYVKARTGWFSCRSACYLASGRPVVAQDTGWSSHVPTGEGLMAFSTTDEAIDAIATVAADPPRHARAARELAREHFASDRVLGALLSEVGAA